MSKKQEEKMNLKESVDAIKKKFGIIGRTKELMQSLAAKAAAIARQPAAPVCHILSLSLFLHRRGSNCLGSPVHRLGQPGTKGCPEGMKSCLRIL